MIDAIWGTALGALALLGQGTLSYRGLTPGMPLTALSQAAPRLAAGDSLTCRTSPRTARLMECGLTVDDHGARPFLSAFVIAGQVAMLNVADSGGPELVQRWQERLGAAYGSGTPTHRAMIQWVDGETVARLTWRAAGQVRWISLTLTHDPTMARIQDYLPSPPERRPRRRRQASAVASARKPGAPAGAGPTRLLVWCFAPAVNPRTRGGC